MKRLMAFIRMRIGFIRRRVRYSHLRIGEKNILVICESGWRGVKQIRRYEVVDEIGPDGERLYKRFRRPSILD